MTGLEINIRNEREKRVLENLHAMDSEVYWSQLDFEGKWLLYTSDIDVSGDVPEGAFEEFEEQLDRMRDNDGIGVVDRVTKIAEAIKV